MGKDQPRLTAQTLKVLGVLMASPECEVSGSEIARNTKLASGTLYLILLRLEEVGWAKSRWETEDPSKLGRPRRRLYQITGGGAARASAAFHDLSSSMGRFAWR